MCKFKRKKNCQPALLRLSTREREVGVIDLEPTPSLPTPLMHNYKLGGKGLVFFFPPDVLLQCCNRRPFILLLITESRSGQRHRPHLADILAMGGAPASCVADSVLFCAFQD